MSKSKGEFLTVSLLEEKGYSSLAYRFFCLQSHYRKPLEFSFENLDNAVKAYDKLKKVVGKLEREGEADQAEFEKYKAKFLDALNNDLNTSMAITVLYEVLKADISDKTKVSLVESFEEVLSLGLLDAEEEAPAGEEDKELEAFVLAKIEERAQAKKAKDFAKADEIRNMLLEKGVVIKDTREGVEWTKA